PGPVYFVAGNKDWDNSGTKGYKNVLHQETFIENYLGNPEAFMPGNGCPGPIEVSVDESLTLIFIDTQWWLHENEKSGEDSPCGITTETDFLFLLNDAIRRNVRKKVIVVGHHPMSSTGPHGGKVSPRWHLLPGIGTIYAGYRSMVGNFQDITNTKYRQLSKAVKNVFATHPELIYVSAHDRSLQYQKLGENHQVVSGSGSGTSHVGKRKNTQFAYKHLGFSRINQYEGGELWLEFWVPEEGQTAGKLVYRQQLLKSAVQRQEERAEELATHQYADSTINTIASNGYPVKNFMKRGIFGFNYRKVWSDTVYNVPYFDLATEQGGMSIIKRGGGMQTRSLRMRNNKGEQWVLRSIEKYPESAIPPPLRGTVAGDAVKDMISSSHPYAALVVPPMADAVGVYHTNPKLMYLPSDPRLGTYRQDMAKGLYIYEERAAGNWENQPSFGNSKKLINTLDVIHKTQKNGDQYVDQQQVLRSRLFDVILGDWDRHDDQWRWAKLKDEDGRTFYRPIPRDRDQAFFWSDGFVLWI
ncbi:MAG: hypothetical protein AAGB22_10680, partial [Bacteroidota bacterium]